MNIEDLVVGEKYLVDDNPVWEDGTPAALRDYDFAYVVYRGVWERSAGPKNVGVVAYDRRGHEIEDGNEFLVAARCLRPYGEKAAGPSPTAARPPYLSETAEQRLQLLRRVQSEFPGGSLEELLAATRWVWSGSE